MAKAALTTGPSDHNAPLVSSNDVARARPLAWSRIAMGTLFLVRTTPLVDWLGFPFFIPSHPLFGWPDGRWNGASWWSFPPLLVACLCVLRTLAAAFFLVGFHTRAAGLAAGIAGYLVLLQQPLGFVFTIHLLYQGTMLLALTDAGSSLALRPAPATAPASGVLLVRLFLASIYAWAGIFKLRADWLDGRALGLFITDGAFASWATRTMLSTPTERALCAISVTVVELALPFLLLLPRARVLGLVAALGLHAIIELVARPDLLGWEMGALLLALWPASDGSRQGEITQGRAAAGQPTSP